MRIFHLEAIASHLDRFRRDLLAKVAPPPIQAIVIPVINPPERGKSMSGKTTDAGTARYVTISDIAPKHLESLRAACAVPTSLKALLHIDIFPRCASRNAESTASLKP